MIIRPCGLWIADGTVMTLRYVYDGRDRFNLPGGGHEGQEEIVATLRREFHEELGVKIVVGDLLFTAETLIRERHVLHLAFRVTELAGTPQIRSSETSALEIVWFPLSDVGHKPLYPAIGADLQAALHRSLPHPRHLGRLHQPWYE
ncbi:MAG: NUDIX domain-containing protein [Magnetococcales bacterium]|nr:NUDIX domain-containing protein [Magnetococcales bacterium]